MVGLCLCFVFFNKNAGTFCLWNYSVARINTLALDFCALYKHFTLSAL